MVKDWSNRNDMNVCNHSGATIQYENYYQVHVLLESNLLHRSKRVKRGPDQFLRERADYRRITSPSIAHPSPIHRQYLPRIWKVRSDEVRLEP